MANIKLDLSYTIFDGASITFKSPADCSEVTGLRIYYPDSEGIIQFSDFKFADANRNDVTDIDKLFSANAMVKILLDTDSNLAFVQNGDTNAYLEGRFDKIEKEHAKSNHDHDGRYYTEEETDTLLSKKSDVLHKHDGEYANKTDFDNLQLVVAANSSTVAEVQDECNALSGQLNGVEQKQNTQALSLQLICSSMEQMVDMVVDEGVSDYWKYRKWNSDCAECWGVFQTNYSTKMSENGNYAITSDVVRVDLPPNLFSKTPVVALTPMGGGYPSVNIANIYKDYFTITIRTEWAVTDMQMWLQIYCIN